MQTSGCTVRVIGSGGAEGDGGGTTAYSTDGVVLYTPLQAETNYASFILIAKKTGCIPANVTVVTTLSATAGQVVAADTQKVDVNTVKTQAVTCSAGITVNPNVGTTQPVNFDGTAASALVKSSLTAILGTALTETAGLIAAAFKKFFNVAAPTATCLSLPDAVPGAAGGGLIAGSNAATTFAGITSTAGVTVTQSAGNGSGIDVTGNGTGAGMKLTGGATGPGFLATGGGNHADADGMRAVAGGVLASDFDADIAGTVTGDVTLAASQPNYDPIAAMSTLIGTPADTDIATDIANVSTQIGSIPGGGDATAANQATIIARLPAALVGGRMDSYVGAMANNSITDAAIAEGAIQVKKNTALGNFEFLMLNSTDHVTPKTGCTVACQRSIDGGAFADCDTVTATEVGAGVYKVNLAATDLNGTVITLRFTATGADATYVTVVTQ